MNHLVKMWNRNCVGRFVGLSLFILCANGMIPTTDIMPDYPNFAHNYVLNVTILITLTTGGVLPTDLGRTGAAIEMAIRQARQTILPNVFVHYDILTKSGMNECSDEENHATYLVTHYAYEKAGENKIPPVGLLAGPACTGMLNNRCWFQWLHNMQEELRQLIPVPAGMQVDRLSHKIILNIFEDMELPLVNSQATSDYFDDLSLFKTLTRMAYTMITLDAFSFKVLDALNYTHVGVIYDEVMPWSQVTGQVFYRAMYYRQHIRMHPRQLPYKTGDNINKKVMLAEAAKEARVILVMAKAPIVREWMLIALELGMCNGDYLFITYEWFRSPYYGEYTWKYNDDKDEKAREAYRVLLKITSHEYWTEPAFKKWSDEVKSLAETRFGYNYGPHETVAPTVTGMHDGIILYAYALNETIAAGEDPFNGTLVTKRMWNRTIPSPEGVVKVKENGVKDQSYQLVQSNSVTGGWDTIMSYDGISGIFRSDIRPIVWIGSKGLPADEPECGFQNEKLSCLLKNDNSTVIIAVVVVVGLFGVFSVVGFCRYRKYKFEQELQDDWWKILHDDVIVNSKSETSHYSMKSLTSGGPQNSIYSADESMVVFKPSFSFSTLVKKEHISRSVGKYNGKLVFIRRLKDKVPVTRDFLLHLSKLRVVIHDNLNRLVGICAEPGFEAAYTEYCIKHSLSDLIHNDSINLDWSFKFSLITDLVTGMDFLHNSFFHSHGYLHSSNCVIDGRFALKITDFHLPTFRDRPTALINGTQGIESDIDYKSLLWRAPEHLRLPMPINGTQKGDSYSCGIIFQEVSVRSEPFYDQLGTLSLSTIITKVARGEDPPFRPMISTEGIPRDILHVITMCLHERPEDRPSFHGIKITLRGSKLMKEGNIMDNLLKRMEKYAQDLEALVAERTGAFFEEKKKAEELLYQVMPKAIADVLKVGGYIPAEAFDCVTVYFSDIVGFVELSAASTPFEIVEFLNDVYTLFDHVIEGFDAYKVETISDTYMVASGLPTRNGNRHAFEIARMALTFLDEASRFKIKHRPDLILNLRIGINSGPCAAGIVGLKMPRYCLFGDTINTASRMESTGKALWIQISDTTKVILDTFDAYTMELRGEIEVKGKGTHITYWLLGMTGTRRKSLAFDDSEL